MTMGGTDSDGLSLRERLSRAVVTTAFLLLLCSVTARCFLSELPFASSQLREALSAKSADELPVERLDIARVAFAVLLLSTVALWLAGGALRGRLVVRHGWLAGLIVLFGGWALVSSLAASNKRAALTGWFEQVSLLSAAFVTVQLCRDRRRFILLVVVLAGIGFALAAKGIWQSAVEIPEQIADFETHRMERLQQAGVVPGTAQARAYEARLRSTTPVGFFNLSNIFASLLVVAMPVGAGLTIAKFLNARSNRKRAPTARKAGEIDPAALAAILTAAATLAVAFVLLLTRSRGAALAVLIALAGLGVSRVLKRRPVSRWRLCVLAAAVMVLLLTATVVTVGLKTDKLPSRTMTFRWYYWTASARIIRDQPVLGVGPGNFHSAYLRYRRPAAEEAVRAPHNFLMHAASQFGLIGGTAYAAVLLGLLLSATKPANRPENLGQSPPPPQQGQLITLTILLVVFMAISRAIFSGIAVNGAMLLLEAILPAVVLAASLLLAEWQAGRVSTPILRAALACGAAAFLTHNLVTFSLWTPAAALMFYLAAGAAAAQSDSQKERRISRFLRAAALAGALAVLAAVGWFLRPTLTRARLTERMLRNAAAGNFREATKFAEQAALADPLDPMPAADVTRLILWTCPPEDLSVIRQRMKRARWWARQAIHRDPADSALYRLAAMTAWYHAAPDYYAYSWPPPPADPASLEERLRKRLRHDPRNPRLLLALAAAAYARNDCDEALRLLKITLVAAGKRRHIRSPRQGRLASRTERAGPRRVVQGIRTRAPRTGSRVCLVGAHRGIAAQPPKLPIAADICPDALRSGTVRRVPSPARSR